MKRRAICLAVGAVSLALAVSAQNPPAGSADKSAEKKSSSASPFNFTFGPQEDGGLGAVLKGGKYYSTSTGWQTSRTLFSPFAGVDIDAGWSTNDEARNNASISLKPSLGISSVVPGTEGRPPRMIGPWLHVFADARERTGNFPKKDSDSFKRLNQTLLGGGVELRWATYNEMRNAHLKNPPTVYDEIPRLTLTYYAVRDRGHVTADVPKEIKANAIQLRGRADLTIPLQCTTTTKTLEPDETDIFERVQTIRTCPWGFLADIAATRPTTGKTSIEMFYDVGIYFNTASEMKPVIRYRTGKEQGFTFDRQFILGMLLRLGG